MAAQIIVPGKYFEVFRLFPLQFQTNAVSLPHFPASIRNGKQSWMYFNHWERAVVVTVLSFFKETARFFSDLPLYFRTMSTGRCRGDFYRRPYDLHIINTKNLCCIQPFTYLCTQNEGTTQAKVVTNHREIAHRAQCS